MQWFLGQWNLDLSLKMKVAVGKSGERRLPNNNFIGAQQFHRCQQQFHRCPTNLDVHLSRESMD